MKEKISKSKLCKYFNTESKYKIYSEKKCSKSKFLKK